MISLNLKNRILLRVYALFLLRQMKNSIVIESLVFAVLMCALFFIVSVPSVLSNIWTSGNIYRYLISAVSEADLAVQLILVSVVIVTIVRMRNLIPYGLKFRQLTA